jgi:hypothetical protein
VPIPVERVPGERGLPWPPARTAGDAVWPAAAVASSPSAALRVPAKAPDRRPGPPCRGRPPDGCRYSAPSRPVLVSARSDGPAQRKTAPSAPSMPRPPGPLRPGTPAPYRARPTAPPGYAPPGPRCRADQPAFDRPCPRPAGHARSPARLRPAPTRHRATVPALPDSARAPLIRRLCLRPQPTCPRPLALCRPNMPGRPVAADAAGWPSDAVLGRRAHACRKVASDSPGPSREGTHDGAGDFPVWAGNCPHGCERACRGPALRAVMPSCPAPRACQAPLRCAPRGQGPAG